MSKIELNGDEMWQDFQERCGWHFDRGQKENLSWHIKDYCNCGDKSGYSNKVCAEFYCPRIKKS